MAFQEIIYDNLVDILCVQETKLDVSFPGAQFGVPGYQLFRQDRKGHGGGIAVYVRSYIPTRRPGDLELIDRVEDISVEMNINKDK